MTFARRRDPDGTRPWHKLENGRAKCGKPLSGQVETTEERPLNCLTCPRCMGYGYGIKLQPSVSPHDVTEAPAAVYGKPGW